MKTNLQQLDIDSLVRQIMADLSRSTRGRGQGKPVVPVPSFDEPASEGEASAEDKTGDIAELRLSERLISLSLINQYDNANRTEKGVVRRWRVPHKVVITPAARDELQKRGITLFFDECDDHTVKPADVSNTSLLVVNHLATEQKVPPVLMKLFQSYHAETLNQSCLLKTTQIVAERATESGTLAIVLTAYPGLASALANRRVGLRAIVAESLDVLKKEAELLAPNLLLVNPGQTLLWQSQEIIRWFVERSPRCPASFLETAL